MNKKYYFFYFLTIFLTSAIFLIPIKAQEPEWDFLANPIQITNSANDHTYHPDLSVRSNGEIHVSYDLTTLVGDDEVRWASTQTHPYQNITYGGFVHYGNPYIQDNAIAVDSNGIVHIIFISGNGATELYYINNAGGLFGIGNRVKIGEGATSCDIAVDNNDNVWVVFRNNTGVYVCNDKVSLQTSIEYIQDTGMYSSRPKIDAYVYPHIVFSNGTGSSKEIYYSKDTGAGFISPLRASPASTSFECFSPDIAVDKNEVPHIVYTYDWILVTGSYELFYSYNLNTAYHITNDTMNQTNPAIAIATTTGTTGSVCIVYEKDIGGGNENIFIKIQNPGQDFLQDLIGVETALTTSPFSDLEPDIAIDGGDNIHVVWYGYNDTVGTFQLKYNYGLKQTTTTTPIPGFTITLIIATATLIILYRKFKN